MKLKPLTKENLAELEKSLLKAQKLQKQGALFPTISKQKMLNQYSTPNLPTLNGVVNSQILSARESKKEEPVRLEHRRSFQNLRGYLSPDEVPHKAQPVDFDKNSDHIEQVSNSGSSIKIVGKGRVHTHGDASEVVLSDGWHELAVINALKDKDKIYQEKQAQEMKKREIRRELDEQMADVKRKKQAMLDEK